MHGDYAEKVLQIMAFPCNQFGGQEPGNASEIEQVLARYGVKFPVMGKCKVNGSFARPLFRYLREKTMGGLDITWNFNKFLCDEKL